MTKEKLKEVKSIQLRSNIVSIELGNFTVAVIDKSVQSKLIKKKYVYEFNITTKLDSKLKFVTLTLNVRIYSEETKQLLLGEIDSTGVFEIENFQEIIDSHGGGIPNIIITMFYGVLISTTRGFLILKSKGTIVQGAIIPMINPTELFKESMQGKTPVK